MQPFCTLHICESLSTNKPSDIGQWLRVRLSLVAGMAFLFFSVLVLAGIVIVRVWGSYSVTGSYLQGHSCRIIVLMNQPRVAALSGTPIGSS